MEYQREMWILILFILAGAVIYMISAEYSTILWNKNQENTLQYWIVSKAMLMGLFISGVSIMVFCRKIERLRDVNIIFGHKQTLEAENKGE